MKEFIKVKRMIGWVVLMGLMVVPVASIAHAESVTLHDCLVQAIEHNPQLVEGKLGVMAGKEEITSSKGKHFPRVSLDANYTDRQTPLPYIPAQSTTIPAHFSDEFASWQAVLTLPLYQGGQIENGIKLAEVRQAMREDTLVLTRNDIIANTVNAYNKVLQLKILQTASKSSVKALTEQLNNVELLYNLGRVARVDLLKVKVQLANENQRLASISESLSASRETLAYLTGKSVTSSDSQMEPTGELSFTDFTCDFDQGLAIAYEHRPEYLIAGRGTQEAGLNKKISTGKLLPTVSALGGYLDQTGFDPRHGESNWFFGLNVSIPLFDRSIYADITRDRILKEKADTRRTGVENQIRLDIHNAINSVTESRRRVEDTRATVTLAEESFRIEQEKYSTGAGTMVDMLFAQAADFTASANYSQALFDYNAAIVAYRRATGTLEDYLK